jgi:hypothetical protein
MNQNSATPVETQICVTGPQGVKLYDQWEAFANRKKTWPQQVQPLALAASQHPATVVSKVQYNTASLLMIN